MLNCNYFPEQPFLPLQLSFPLQPFFPPQELVDLASTLAADLSVSAFVELYPQPESINVAAADARAKPDNFVTLFIESILQNFI